MAKIKESKDLERLAMQSNFGQYDKKYQEEKTARTNRRQGRHAINSVEDSWIDAIEIRRDIEKIGPLLEKLNKGQLDVAGLFQGVSAQMAVQLLRQALAGDSEKIRHDATKHALALAGYNPATKHEISRVDAETPKAALIAMITGASADLKKQGIEVDDDRDDPVEPQGP